MPKGANNAGGYLLLHKNRGITSFDSLHQVKRALKTGKVGHTGTLDKFAEGLLVLLTGKYTSLVPIFNDLDKVYIGRVRFGIETDTLDPEGTVVFTAPVPPKERVLQILPHFIGPQHQIPPAYSAIHVHGQRASERIRSGQTVEMPAREVTIHSIEVLHFEEPIMTIRIHCSKGTYIRALARDIGRATGSCAYLEALHRTAVGPFTDKYALDPAPGEAGLTAIQEAVQAVDPELFHQLTIPVLFLDTSDYAYVLQGRPLTPLLNRYHTPENASMLGIFSAENTLLALVGSEEKGGKRVWSYKHVYPH